MSPPPSRPTPPALTWVALLGFALFAPAALPAGGGDRRLPEVRRRESAREPLLNPAPSSLRSSPRARAPVLRPVEAGLPLRVLGTWVEPGGRRWLRVATGSAGGRATRGWLID